AAAAAILAFLAIQLRHHPLPPGFSVAVAPSFESASDYIDSVAELRGLRPPGVDSLRSGGGDNNVDVGTFVRRAEEAERAGAQLALLESHSEVAAGFFVVPIELSTPSWVVIV